VLFEHLDEIVGRDRVVMCPVAVPVSRGCANKEPRSWTGQYRQWLSRGEAVEAILPEAFAIVREAARRTIGLRHHDAQLMGGPVLHLGMVAEMRTGEGKTLTATLPAYLATMSGQPVHVMTRMTTSPGPGLDAAGVRIPGATSRPAGYLAQTRSGDATRRVCSGRGR
jgi:hypothetical protein